MRRGSPVGGSSELLDVGQCWKPYTPCAWSRTTLPSDSSMTRLRIWSTTPASWVAMTTVVPVRVIRSSSFMMPTEVAGSRFPVGSSAIRIIGRLTNARAIATRCCSPPESSSGMRSPLPSRPTSSRVSGTVFRMSLRDLPITCSANATFSVTVLLGSSRKSWKTVPIWRRSRGTFQPASRLRSLPAPEPVEVFAGDVHAATGRAGLAQHQPQRGRLPRAGLADEEDELALLDVDADLVERRLSRARVGLADLLEPNHVG